jgi:broad specificity phosphatase PhoE
MRLILVRHGESVGNFENRLQGQEDYDLTDLGREQAIATAERLHRLGTSALYTSPLMRAANTAHTIGRRIGIEPRLLPDVAEYHFGELSGGTYADVRRHFDTQSGTTSQPGQFQERVYPGEEGRENFYRRVTESIWAVMDTHPGETVAVVSHGGPIALFCQTVLGLPYKRPMPFGVNNCSLNVIDAPDDELARDRVLTLLQLNDTCHLREREKLKLI